MSQTRRRPRGRPKSLGQAIREAREALGWSQAKLARMLEVPESSVRNWESGRNLPSHPHYARMCLLFSWSLPYSGESSTARESSFPGWPMLSEPSVLASAGAGG